jgi:hypothetical protein
MNDHNHDDMQASLFAHLVITLATSTMQHLGKMLNPMTNKAEVNLDAAQATIDMLDMLEAKTRGNLGPDEAKMLKDTLTSLKLNYVETMQSSPATPPAEATEKKPEIETPPGSGGKDKSDEKGSRFHKTYG